jgi:hypothetical protein
MKEIKPVSIWYNGQTINATIFSMNSISDNLSTNATFYYQLFSANNIQLAQGNLTIEGSDYTSYSSSQDSNAYAYDWAATELGLTIIGDYVPTTPSE